MKKISMWLTALTTSFVSLLAMLLFDYLLSTVYFYIGKVPFLSEALDFIGEILDLGLTALFAIFLIGAIWKLGHSIIEKINGKEIEFTKSPICYVNNLFLVVFLVALVFLVINFATIIKDVVTSYTSDTQGLGTILTFFEALKDAAIYVCDQNIILYKIGSNSIVLFFINIFLACNNIAL